MNFGTFKKIIQDTLQEWGEDKATRLAAAVAYYTVFALPPLLLLLLTIARLIYGGDSDGQLEQMITEQVGPTAGDAITSILGSDQADNAARNAAIATLVSIATLLFGASGLFIQLEDAMNTIWDVERQSTGIMGFIKKRGSGVVMVLGFGFLLLVSLAASAFLSGFSGAIANALPGSTLIYQIINFIVSFAVVTLLFAMIFKFVPDVQIEWRDVWLGAALTALLFSVGKWALGLYIGSSAITSSYGAAGSLIALLLWVYYSAQILFFGAEFTQVYARHRGARIEPDDDAVRLEPEKRTKQGMSPKRKKA